MTGGTDEHGVPGRDTPSPEPRLRLNWTDPVTGRHGYVVLHTVVSGLTSGGTRLRRGCTLAEVEDLARGMALKTATFGIPVGGAKGGLDSDPKDPQTRGVLRRFLADMRPLLEAHWVTAEDLGLPQHVLDGIFDELGLGQSYHAAIRRAPDPARTLARVRAALSTDVGGLPLGDVVGGYGVAQACLAVAEARGWEPGATTVAVQGFGTMGGGAAHFLAEAGLRVVAVADAGGTAFDPKGLDVDVLLSTRDEYGEVTPPAAPSYERLPRDAVLGVDADILVPAAVSYALTGENADRVDARVVVEAANAAVTPSGEQRLAERGVPVVPDFVANAGAAAWAWWVLLGWVGSAPAESFTRLAGQMRPLVRGLVDSWDGGGVRPREAATARAAERARQFVAAEAAGEVLARVR